MSNHCRWISAHAENGAACTAVITREGHVAQGGAAVVIGERTAPTRAGIGRERDVGQSWTALVIVDGAAALVCGVALPSALCLPHRTR